MRSIKNARAGFADDANFRLLVKTDVNWLYGLNWLNVSRSREGETRKEIRRRGDREWNEDKEAHSTWRNQAFYDGSVKRRRSKRKKISEVIKNSSNGKSQHTFRLIKLLRSMWWK